MNPPVSLHSCALRRSTACLERLDALLDEQAPEYPILEVAADHLCVTPRTLKRHLGRHGLRYQDLLDSRRYAHAQRLLAELDLSVEEVAGQVGFAGAASFSRAFRRWSGSAPGSFRRRDVGAISPVRGPAAESGTTASRPLPPPCIPA